jgi:hypothetical protein
MGRQVVESANAALKGVFTDLGRGFFRVFGVTKVTVLLGFTLAAFNLARIRSFRAKHALDEAGRPTEKPKRRGPSAASVHGPRRSSRSAGRKNATRRPSQASSLYFEITRPDVLSGTSLGGWGALEIRLPGRTCVR